LTEANVSIMHVTVRTTVTLDKDAERLLRTAMHSRRKSFKEMLNDAIRSALGDKSATKHHPRFVLKALPMGLRPGIDPTGLNKLADDLEVDGILAKNRRGMADFIRFKGLRW
jgi:hypothetical protein